MLEEDEVVAHRKARAERLKARGRWVAALGAIAAAVYTALMAAAVLVVGEGPRPFGLPPATAEEAQTAALVAVGVGCWTGVVRALVCTRAAGRRREGATLVGALVVVVPLSLAIQLKAPSGASTQGFTVFVAAACAFGGLFFQDQLTIKAENLEEEAKEEERWLRRQELAAAQKEAARLHADVERLERREARRATWWGLRRDR